MWDDKHRCQSVTENSENRNTGIRVNAGGAVEGLGIVSGDYGQGQPPPAEIADTLAPATRKIFGLRNPRT